MSAQTTEDLPALPRAAGCLKLVCSFLEFPFRVFSPRLPGEAVGRAGHGTSI